MTDYKKLVEALRFCSGTHTKPTKCPDYGEFCGCGGKCLDKHLTDAAAAIEDLEGFLSEAERDRDEYEERMRKEQERVLDLQARLEEAENSVENYKRMWLEKHEPKTARWEGWTSTHWSKRCDSNGDPIYTEHTYYQCSYCGRRTVVRENICPNCGAVMEDMCEVQK